MKLLLDENLSDRIVPQIQDYYPNSAHVKSFGLINTDDTEIWTFAAQHGYTIVSKDADFHQRSLAYGHPPKFIYLRVGNCPTQRITFILRAHKDILEEFEADPTASVLVLK